MLLWICPLRLELNEPDPYQTQRAGQHRPAVVRRTPAEISVPDRAAAPLGAMIADRSLSGRILNLLAEMGDRAAPAVPYLAAALEDREDKVVYNAAFALSRVGPAAAGAIEELTAALEHRDKLVR